MTEAMDLDPHPRSSLPKTKKSLPLTTLTLPPSTFSYAHLTLLSPSTVQLDPLQLKSYLTSALSQFLGQTGTAIPIDILSVSSSSAWVRLPRPDLAAFSAAIAAFPGISSGRERIVLKVEAAGDYLGALISRSKDGDDIWGP
ncbi:hypothetical protein QBC40DRAFT_274263 [Triangularia verruculosa]|uniref:Ribonucleases P/MRP subunit Pop8-like domain-containing protein n=1 Tax=Triangularia verruculosa TaxID=2587418 RepID=A0AAN7AZ00_9PEZI|nr:hypothetical protein QBC40DRAFT_274263 [Triangularia verruculosa]